LIFQKKNCKANAAVCLTASQAKSALARFACEAQTTPNLAVRPCKAQSVWRRGAACTNIALMCAEILHRLQRTNALMKRVIGRGRGMVCLHWLSNNLNFFVKSSFEFNYLVFSTFHRIKR
jgi:hypothetical protein